MEEIGVPLLSGFKDVRAARQLGGQLVDRLRKAQLFEDAHGALHLVGLPVRRVVLDETDLRVSVGYQHVVDGVVILGIFHPQLVGRLLHHFVAHAVIGGGLFAAVQHVKDGLVFGVGELAQDLHVVGLLVQPADAVCLIAANRVKDHLVDLGAQLPAPGAQVVALPGVGVQTCRAGRRGLVQVVEDVLVQLVDKDVLVVSAQGFDGVAVISVPQPVQRGQLLHHAAAAVVSAVPAVLEAVQGVDALGHALGHALLCGAGVKVFFRLFDLLVGSIQTPLGLSGLLDFAHVCKAALDADTQLFGGLGAHHVALLVGDGAALLGLGSAGFQIAGFFVLVFQPVQGGILAHVFADDVDVIVVIIQRGGQSLQRFQLTFHGRGQRQPCATLIFSQGASAGHAGGQRFLQAFLSGQRQAFGLDSSLCLCYSFFRR